MLDLEPTRMAVWALKVRHEAHFDAAPHVKIVICGDCVILCGHGDTENSDNHPNWWSLALRSYADGWPVFELNCLQEGDESAMQLDLTKLILTDFKYLIDDEQADDIEEK